MTKYHDLTDLEQREVVAEKVLGWEKGISGQWQRQNGTWTEKLPDWSWGLFGQIVEAMLSKGDWMGFWFHDQGYVMEFVRKGTLYVARDQHPAKAAAEAALRVVAPEMFGK